jgi:dihydroorotase-like cyclic amidohydrolase
MALTKFPGFIDVHVHLRDPGATHKEDFTSGSRAAIKGGFTFICDMPNNSVPTFSPEALDDKVVRSKELALCDIGFHYGTNGKNTDTFEYARSHPQVFGLKLYCNHTTGDYLIEDPVLLEKVFSSWQSEKPILVHAEGHNLETAIELAKHHNQRLHVCHVSQSQEVAWIREAKKKGVTLSAGVTPHHLFLTKKDVTKLGSKALMKPELGDNEGMQALWEGIQDGTIDLVESDHAPHTLNEKASSALPFGVPGLETTIGLLMHAVVDAKISLQQVTTLLHDNPKKIFHIPDQRDTYIELDPEKSYIVGTEGYETKCGWSPFDGWELYGQVENVVFKGKMVLEKTKIVNI